MEDYQRDKILLNISYLVEKTNDFETVFEGLQAKGMFNAFMVDEIKNTHKESRSRLRFLYWYVTTRGPKAFSQLCEVLKETGNGDLVTFLSGERCYKEIHNENGTDYPNLEEEYPNGNEWIVTNAIKRMDIDRKRVYKMGSKIKGLALIINIKSFVNNIYDEREGSEHDISRLESILSQLAYKVRVCQNLSAKDIVSKLEEFAGEEDHYRCDSAIVFVMSHGIDDFNATLSNTINIVGHDAAVVNSQIIIKQLMAYKCEALRGKPKLFFFQACRGGHFNYNCQPVYSETNSQRDSHSEIPNHVQTDGRPLPQSEYIRTDSDIIIGYSTTPGYVSLRHPDRGSWYIQTLCRVIAKYAWKEDLVTMLEIVKSECHRENSTHPDWNIDCWQISRGVNKKFYFQPGITQLDFLNGS